MTAITTTTAVPSGIVTPQQATGVEVALQWGTASGWQSQTDWQAQSGSAERMSAFPLDALAPGTTYDYRLVARSNVRVLYAESGAFTTAAPPAGIAPNVPAPAPGPPLTPAGPGPAVRGQSAPCAGLKSIELRICRRLQTALAACAKKKGAAPKATCRTRAKTRYSKLLKATKGCSSRKGKPAQASCRVRAAAKYRSCAVLGSAERRLCTRRLSSKGTRRTP